MERLTGRKLPQSLLGHFLNLLMFSYYNDYRLMSQNEFYVKMPTDINFQVSNHIFLLVQLKFSPFFKGLTQRQKNLIVSHFECKVFLPNETILSKKNSSPGIFFIVKGKAVLGRKKGNQSSIIYLKRGSYFGEDFLVGKKPVLNVYNAGKVLKTLFVPYKFINFINESELQMESLNFLYILTFKRRVFHKMVTFIRMKRKLHAGF